MQPVSRSQFEVAIFCALGKEANAIHSVLDTRWDISLGRRPGDQNVYTLGAMGNRNVVLVHLAGMGTVHTTIAAAGLQASFPSISLVIIAGVCGGVPLMHDRSTFLGDLVISTGLIQYDLGRLHETGFVGKASTSDSFSRPHPTIRAWLALHELPAEKESLNRSMINTFHDMLNRHPDANSLKAEDDKLYRNDYPHVHRGTRIPCDCCSQTPRQLCNAAVDANCATLGCESDNGVLRTRSYTARGHTDSRSVPPPAIHFGKFGCGNAVVRSALYRDDLASKEQGLLAFEMEAAGVWELFPCLIVKSVCDYADSHKDKRWTEYAALVAAAGTSAIVSTQIVRDKTNLNEFWMVPRSPSVHFTGRQALLQHLRDLVGMSLDSEQLGSPCRIALTGIGGLGKSELCLKIAHEMRHMLWGVFWINAGTLQQAETCFLRLAKSLKHPVDTIEEACELLAGIAEPWLLIIDNADDPDFDYNTLYPSGSNGCVIITSRNPECAVYGSLAQITLDNLESMEALELVRKVVQISPGEWARQVTHAETLCDTLGNHPLALVQAGSYVAHGYCALSEYLSLFMVNRRRLLESSIRQCRPRYDNAYATFEITTTRLDSDHTSLARDAVSLLCAISMMSRTDLPVSIFALAWTGKQKVPWHGLGPEFKDRSDSWYSTNCLGVVYTSQLGECRIRLMEAMQKLSQLGLVSFGGTIDSLGIFMHPLCHMWAKERQDNESQIDYWLETACTFVMLAKEDVHDSYDLVTRLRPHILALLRFDVHSLVAASSARRVVHTRYQLCRLLAHCEAYGDVVSSIEHTLVCVGAAVDVVVIEYRETYDLLAISLFQTGKENRAISLSQQIIDIVASLHGPKSTHLLYYLAQLASMHGQMSEPGEVSRLSSEMLTLDQKDLPPQHTDALWAKGVLARAHIDAGEIEEGIEMFNDLIACTREPDDTEAKATWFKNAQPVWNIWWHCELAKAHHARGEMDRALEVLKTASRTPLSSVPKAHVKRNQLEFDLATLLYECGKFEEAQSILTSLVVLVQEMLPPSNKRRIEYEARLSKFSTGQSTGSLKRRRSERLFKKRTNGMR